MIRGCTGALLAVTLLVTACSDDDDGDTSAITSIPDDTTSSSSTTEPRTVAPDVIPDDESLITEAYVEGVLNALAAESSKALVATRDAGGVDEAVIDIIKAISTDVRAAASINALASAALDGFDEYRPNPEPGRYKVSELRLASRTCVVALAEVDPSGAFVDPVPSTEVRASLVPATTEQRSSGLNPTAWVLAGTVPTTETSDDSCSTP